MYILLPEDGGRGFLLLVGLAPGPGGGVGGRSGWRWGIREKFRLLAGIKFSGGGKNEPIKATGEDEPSRGGKNSKRNSNAGASRPRTSTVQHRKRTDGTPGVRVGLGGSGEKARNVRGK